MSALYIPDAGDIVWLDANRGSDTHVATKNGGPAVVLSPKCITARQACWSVYPLPAKLRVIRLK